MSKLNLYWSLNGSLVVAILYEWWLVPTTADQILTILLWS